MGSVSSKSDLEVHSTAASTPDTVEAIEVAAEQPSCSSGPSLGFNLMTSSSSFSVSYGLSQIQVIICEWHVTDKMASVLLSKFTQFCFYFRVSSLDRREASSKFQVWHTMHFLRQFLSSMKYPVTFWTLMGNR